VLCPHRVERFPTATFVLQVLLRLLDLLHAEIVQRVVSQIQRASPALPVLLVDLQATKAHPDLATKHLANFANLVTIPGLEQRSAQAALKGSFKQILDQLLASRARQVDLILGQQECPATPALEVSFRRAMKMFLVPTVPRANFQTVVRARAVLAELGLFRTVSN
jgi:hypothetical protein